jgi:hypothetical protein
MFQNITPAQLHDNYILTYFGGTVCVRAHRSASTSIPKVIAKRLMSCHQYSLVLIFYTGDYGLCYSLEVL